jgi:hypothetical protein
LAVQTVKARVPRSSLFLDRFANPRHFSCRPPNKRYQLIIQHLCFTSTFIIIANSSPRQNTCSLRTLPVSCGKIEANPQLGNLGLAGQVSEGFIANHPGDDLAPGTLNSILKQAQKSFQIER